MPLTDFNLDVNVLQHALTTPQKLAIRTALHKLKLQENVEWVQFWGKIFGTQTDYFVAVAITLGTSITKRFYFSNDHGVTFALLPDVDDFVRKLAPLIRGRFTGNPTLKYKDPLAPKKKKTSEDGEEEEEEEEEEGEEEEEEEQAEGGGGDDENGEVKKKVPPRKVTELERLSHTVRRIDHDTTLIPLGTTFLSPTGHVTIDRTFAGIDAERARSLDSYGRFRDAHSPMTLARIRKHGATNNTNYLDLIAHPGEKGKELWTLQVDPSGQHTTIRSLYWLGYEFKIEAHTTSYSGAYFGLGESNDDIRFML